MSHRPPLTDSEKLDRAEKIDAFARKLNKVVYGGLALAGVVYVASREGARRGCADFTRDILAEVEKQKQDASSNE